jgi:outer membrane protein
VYAGAVRALTWVLVAGVVAFSSSALASANFGNRSLGLSAGAYTLRNDFVPVPWALSLWIEGGFYIDSGFELYLRVPLSVGFATTGINQPGGGTGPGPVFGSGGQFGVRYLFSQESLRPWLGGHISGLVFFGPPGQGPFVGSAGAGLNGGLEYFVSESIALGIRAFVDLNFNFANTFLIAPSLGGALTAATYF